MIDKFGRLMMYVNDVRACADFWINNFDFAEVDTIEVEGKLISVELLPYDACDVNICLFDKAFVIATSPLPAEYLAMPSLLFSSYNLEETQGKLKARGVQVSEISEMGGIVNFNFPDCEGNYFAMRQVSKE